MATPKDIILNRQKKLTQALIEADLDAVEWEIWQVPPATISLTNPDAQAQNG